MPKVIDSQLLDSIRKPDYLIDELLDKQLERIEEVLGKQAKGLGNKVLALFVQNGVRVQLSEQEVIREFSIKKNVDTHSVRSILDLLKQSGLLQISPGGNFELPNNFIAQRAFRKIESDNRVLRSILLTIQDRMSREQLLDQQYLNYMTPMMDQLELSEVEQEFVQDSRQAIRKERRVFRLFLTLMFLALLALASWALYNGQETQKSNDNLKLEYDKTRDAEDQARKSFIAAKSAEALARDAEQYAQRQRANAESQRYIADSLRFEAVGSRDLAIKERINAERMRQRAEQEAKRNAALEKQARDSSDIYNRLRLGAQKNEEVARMERDRAQRLSKIIASRNAAVRTLQMEDRRLRALVAMEAYNINRMDAENGNPLQPDIFKSLYTATRALNPQLSFTQTKHKGGVRDIVFHPDKNVFYSTGSDGVVQEWPIRSWNTVGTPQLGDLKKLEAVGGGVQNALAISGDGRQLLVAGEPAYFQILNTRSGKVEVTLNKTRGEEIFLGGFTKTGGFYAMSQRQFYIWEPGKEVKSFPKLSSKTGGFLPDYPEKGDSRLWSFLGVYNNYAYELNISEFDGGQEKTEEDNIEGTQKEVDFGNITAVAVSIVGNKTLVAYGFNTGRLYIIEGADLSNLFQGEGNQNKRFKHHQAAVSDVVFSPDGRWLAAASYDGTVSLWEMSRYNSDASYQPTVLDGHNSWVLSLAFSNDSHNLLAGCQDGSIHFWNLNPENYANQLCLDLRGALDDSIEERKRVEIRQKKSIQQTDFDELTMEEYRLYFGEPDKQRLRSKNSIGGVATGIPVCTGR
ncbi:MAG: hypothetical protein SH848_02120 [Saprospiraceae bacterium]|nr:hypothetical protein [Saprospiraceae bacterium]MDZ4702694.1 hypothetical protein [Saprospiraceae bacterium]